MRCAPRFTIASINVASTSALDSHFWCSQLALARSNAGDSVKRSVISTWLVTTMPTGCAAWPLFVSAK